MNASRVPCLSLCGLLFSTLFFTALPVHAEGRRPYTSEFSFRLNYSEAETFNGPNGSYLDVQDDLGFGFSYLYNQSPHWAFGGSFDWIGLDYEAFARADDPANEDFKYRNRMYNYSLNADAVYYLLDQPFTPFVAAKLGWTTIDTNISNGPGYNYCWWDYWGGYYCTSYRPTKSESGLSYGVGLGLRWDINRNYALSGSYRWTEVDIDVAGDNPQHNLWRLEFISKFY
ncbi:MAG: hypothetical protein CMK83_24650 [Pseudomonadales bacterium]|uniref:outer membrane protein n=1 Tax=unclassified Ketobacter TaxID=2639109 RepID=UPI000C947107|nr:MULTISPECIES: outer membrane beta-barrel protein [unclassified Ketobacter]MAQ27412.1 hypothetical protein [Pseudomonadales bacterium]MEC8810097.1 outer membrane beta-barrel protein [Pseudomonadota bacterium]TNC87932.1 MAG: hypothetical protein CSH49_13655 [Alcanivorax sp.]HAG96358.1 hypothetical protein [Gammaproteobacteria bacterium]MCK5789237.1 outer membrane beta-barrel protein [Ketobacter sp.]